MRTDRSFTDPRLPKRLGKRFFPSTCELQEFTITQDVVGDEIRTPETRHVADCGFASGTTVQASDRQSAETVTTIFATHRAVLVGSFPDVRPDTWQAVIDGVTYDIKSVDWAEDMFTMLEMNQQSPVSTNA